MTCRETITGYRRVLEIFRLVQVVNKYIYISTVQLTCLNSGSKIILVIISKGEPMYSSSSNDSVVYQLKNHVSGNVVDFSYQRIKSFRCVP